jgi:hypothetical protein
MGFGVANGAIGESKYGLILNTIGWPATRYQIWPWFPGGIFQRGSDNEGKALRQQ